MTPGVLIISTLDTKGEETYYLKQRIEAGGGRALLMDLSMGAAAAAAADVPPDDVAKAGGWTIDAVRASRDRTKITGAMISGAVKIARELFSSGNIQTVIGLGGATMSYMATDIMRALPFGLPKLMVSSAAALPGLATLYIDTGDIMLFHSVVEIAGLSPLLRSVLDRAAAAALGLVTAPIVTPDMAMAETRRPVAISMFGPCDKLAHGVRHGLEDAGFSVIGFHAAGVCDRAMEDMIGQGFFSGVIDLAPAGVTEYIMGGMRSAGPHRLEAAGRMGIPQVITPSGVNMMSPPRSKYKPDYHQRRKCDLDKHRTWLRLNPEELIEVAKAFAEKLNQANGPVAVLIPGRGWSSADAPGSAAHAPEEDQVFTRQLKALLKPEIEVNEIDAYLEDEAVAKAVIETFIRLAK